MKELLAIIAIIFVTIIVALGATWIGQGNDFFLTKVFAPKYEAVRRETFEQSKAYRQGMAQQIYAAQQEYEQATDSQKVALASIILHRTADCFDTLPPDLQSFIIKLKATSQKSYK